MRWLDLWPATFKGLEQSHLKKRKYFEHFLRKRSGSCRLTFEEVWVQSQVRPPEISGGKIDICADFYPSTSVFGDRGGTVVKVLCYKLEGRWFDPSWFQWIFH